MWCKFIILFIWVLALEMASRSEGSSCLQSERGSVRLTGINSSFTGYIQVCKNGYWTPVSFEEEEWTKKNSIVTCRELGFLESIRVLNKDGPSPHEQLTMEGGSNSLSPWQYYSVECTGLEERLVDCTWSIKNAKLEKRDVIVLCREAPADGEIILVGINGYSNEGIVEIYNPMKTYRWSPICSNEWDDKDAEVACRQLGFKGGLSTYYSSDDDSRSKYLPRKRYSHFRCSGTEKRLNDCNFLGPYPYKCFSDYYAGVVCTTEEEEHTILDLNITLLVFMIIISLLLIIILLLILRCTLIRFKRNSTRSQVNRSRINTCRENIIHTQLDEEMPYASPIAPPSYDDTLLADQRVQNTSDANAEENFNSDDALISSLNELLNSEIQQQSEDGSREILQMAAQTETAA